MNQQAGRTNHSWEVQRRSLKVPLFEGLQPMKLGMKTSRVWSWMHDWHSHYLHAAAVFGALGHAYCHIDTAHKGHCSWSLTDIAVEGMSRHAINIVAQHTAALWRGRLATQPHSHTTVSPWSVCGGTLNPALLMPWQMLAPFALLRAQLLRS